MAEGSDCNIPAVRRFYPGLCALCYKFPSEDGRLKNCSQCFLVSYCSRACQKEDWKTHKPFCTVNAAVDKKTIFSKAKMEVKSKTEWNDFRNSLQVTASINLKRELAAFERDILWYPKVCEICRESDLSKLTYCNSCHSVYYCCKFHMSEDAEHHTKWCQQYLLFVIIDGFEKKKGISNLPFPIQIYRNYSPLPESMKELLKSELESLPAEEVSFRMFTILISERLTDPLTLLYSLEKFCFGNKNINDMTQLTVHVVGAESTRELLGMIRWEYLAHRLPLLRKLHVVFIGPNIFSDLEENDAPETDYCYDDSQEMRCDECIKEKRMYIYEMCRMLYDKYMTRDFYTKPDAIIAYNCGFHEYSDEEGNTWPKSLSCMISDNAVPLLYTSYTKIEAQKDLEALKKLGNITVTIPTHENPFKSMRPVRDCSREDDCPLFYINQCLTGINGQKK